MSIIFHNITITPPECNMSDLLHLSHLMKSEYTLETRRGKLFMIKFWGQGMLF